MDQQVQSRTRELMAEIREALIAYDWRQVSLLAERAVQELPDSPELWAMQSFALWWGGRQQGAEAASRKARELGPDCAIALAQASQLAVLNARLDEAQELADRALAIDGEDMWVLHFAGEAPIATGNSDRAVSIARHRMDLYPDVLNQCMYFDVLLTSGKTAEAESELREAEGLYPKSPIVWTRRARMLLRSTQVAKGLDLLEKAAKHCPGSYGIWGEYALTLTHLGRFDEAEAAARHSLEISPTSLMALQAMSRICEVRGQMTEAQAWQCKAEEANPALKPMTVLSKAHRAMAANDWLTVLQVTEDAAFDLSPTIRTQGLSLRVRALLALGRVSEAEATLDVLDEVLSTGGGMVQRTSCELRAKLLRMKGDTDGAISALRAGIEQSPTDGPMRAELVRLLSLKGSRDEEDAAVRDIMDNPPDWPAGIGPVYLQLAHTRHRPAAREILRQARRRFPQDGMLKILDATARLEDRDFRRCREIALTADGEWALVGRALAFKARILGILWWPVQLFFPPKSED